MSIADESSPAAVDDVATFSLLATVEVVVVRDGADATAGEAVPPLLVVVVTMLLAFGVELP